MCSWGLPCWSIWFINYDITVDPWSVMVNWLYDAYSLHLCEMLLESCLLMN